MNLAKQRLWVISPWAHPRNSTSLTEDLDIYVQKYKIHPSYQMTVINYSQATSTLSKKKKKKSSWHILRDVDSPGSFSIGFEIGQFWVKI